MTTGEDMAGMSMAGGSDGQVQGSDLVLHSSICD